MIPDSNKQRLGIALIALILLSGAAGALSGSVLFDGAITIGDEAGPTVELITTSASELVLDGPDSPGTVEIAHVNGSIVFKSDGSSRVTVKDSDIEGGTTRIEGVEPVNNLTANPGDKKQIVVRSGANYVEWSDYALDDGQTDISYDAGGELSITLSGFKSSQGVMAVAADGETLDSDVAKSDGTVGLTLPSGTNSIRLQKSPSELEIRDMDTKELISESTTVEVQFFGDSDTIETRTTNDGTIDMAGLPTDERFTISVDAGGNYSNRQVIVPSIEDQQTIWLLPSDGSVETVEPRFTLSDPTDQFDEDNSEITISRPIEINNQTKYRAVAGDRVGINGFDTVLERDQRYRIQVRDPGGDVRQLGEFTPTQSEQIDLQIQEIVFNSESDINGLRWAATYDSNEDTEDTIKYNYYDAIGTESLNVTIYERGNKSNNTLVDQTYSGNVSLSEPVADNSTVWVVEWDATRTNGEQISAKRQVSPSRLPVDTPGLGDKWQNISAMVSLYVVAGLFSRANAQVGAISVATLGGMFWMIGWLPSSTTGLMVAVAILIAVLSYVAQRKTGVAG